MCRGKKFQPITSVNPCPARRSAPTLDLYFCISTPQSAATTAAQASPSFPGTIQTAMLYKKYVLVSISSLPDARLLVYCIIGKAQPMLRICCVIFLSLFESQLYILQVTQD
jgi:hypothetical protein